MSVEAKMCTCLVEVDVAGVFNTIFGQIKFLCKAHAILELFTKSESMKRLLHIREFDTGAHCARVVNTNFTHAA